MNIVIFPSRCLFGTQQDPISRAQDAVKGSVTRGVKIDTGFRGISRTWYSTFGLPDLVCRTTNMHWFFKKLRRQSSALLFHLVDTYRQSIRNQPPSRCGERNIVPRLMERPYDTRDRDRNVVPCFGSRRVECVLVMKVIWRNDIERTLNLEAWLEVATIATVRFWKYPGRTPGIDDGKYGNFSLVANVKLVEMASKLTVPQRWNRWPDLR